MKRSVDYLIRIIIPVVVIGVFLLYPLFIYFVEVKEVKKMYLEELIEEVKAQEIIGQAGTYSTLPSIIYYRYIVKTKTKNIIEANGWMWFWYNQYFNVRSGDEYIYRYYEIYTLDFRDDDKLGRELDRYKGRRMSEYLIEGTVRIEWKVYRHGYDYEKLFEENYKERSVENKKNSGNSKKYKY